MNVLFVADPLATLDPRIDATVGLMLATRREGAEVWACTPEDLAVVAGRVRARAVRLDLAEPVRGADHRWMVDPAWSRALEERVLDVADETVLVHLRIDPPVDARYLHTTYLLDLVERAGTPVVNRPEGLRALHEKLVALQLPDLCPATLVSADPAQLRAFLARSGRAVVKPVDGFAGRDVWLVADDASALALLESATNAGTRHVIAQEYLPAVAGGNKRVFVLDGEIVGTVLRRPSPEDFRIGPPVAAVEADDTDRRIVAALVPLLAAHGITLAGLDVIDGQLIEVNVTCPGGMHKTDALLGTDLSGVIVRRLLSTERVSS